MNVNSIVVTDENWNIFNEQENFNMEQKYIDELYVLLEKAEKENDEKAVSALKWAIFQLESKQYLKGTDAMRLFEYMKPGVLDQQEPTRKKFIAKLIVKETKQLAKDKNITENEAYMLLSRGLYGGDRDIE